MVRAIAMVRRSWIERFRVGSLGVGGVWLIGMGHSLEKSSAHGKGQPAREGVIGGVFLGFCFVWNELGSRYLGGEATGCEQPGMGSRRSLGRTAQFPQETDGRFVIRFKA